MISESLGDPAFAIPLALAVWVGYGVFAIGGIRYSLRADRECKRLEREADELRKHDTGDHTPGRDSCILIYCENEYGEDGWYCDACGGWFAATFRHTGHDNIVEPNFCPNCGSIVSKS